MRIAGVIYIWRFIAMRRVACVVEETWRIGRETYPLRAGVVHREDQTAARYRR